jgi:hypothetical protein
VRVDAAGRRRSRRLLDRHGAVDLDEREASVALRGLAGARGRPRGRDPTTPRHPGERAGRHRRRPGRGAGP